MSFYSTLADAYHDLVSDHLFDILNDYPLDESQRDGEQFRQMMSAYADRIDLMMRIKRKTDSFMPFDNRSEEEIERGFARSFIFPFLEKDILDDMKSSVSVDDRMEVVISYMADTAKIYDPLMNLINVLYEDALDNIENNEIPDFIKNKYPFMIVLHDMAI